MNYTAIINHLLDHPDARPVIDRPELGGFDTTCNLRQLFELCESWNCAETPQQIFDSLPAREEWLHEHGITITTRMIDPTDHRVRAIARYIRENGSEPQIPRVKRGVHTLQGEFAVGYVVSGRAHGGDYLGCVFTTRELATAAIEAARLES